MMNVTKNNFRSVLPEVQDAIDNCLFVSIDCEFTGLSLINNIRAFDTPAVYYDKTRRNSQNFLVIQYGLSAFSYVEETDTFKQKSFNFYIFRHPVDRFLPDQRFHCQSSSINFLINQGFDFNKLFKEGIPYLNVDEEQHWQNSLDEHRKNKLNTSSNQSFSNSIPIPDNLESTINDVIDQLEKFLESEDDEVQLPKSNAFVRKLIYQTVGEKYQGRLSLESRQIENDRILFAFRARSKDEEMEAEQKKYEESCQVLSDFKGFSEVVRLLQRSQKLLIGHNMLLDLMHTIDKFLTPLGSDYFEFKQIVQDFFPKIVDTKYMASNGPFKDLITSTVLAHVVDTIQKKPFKTLEIEGENMYSYTINEDKAHEAGYDAFITGVSFLTMWKYLGDLEKKSNKETFTDLSLLSEYDFLNRIHLMILADNQYINLHGEDLNPSRDHVFHLTFPKDWKHHNIIELFQPFGNVYVSWINDCSAYVSLYKKDQAEVVLRTLCQSDIYSIKSFAESQTLTPITPLHQKRKFSDPESSTEAKKRKGDSEWETVTTRRGKRKAAKTFVVDDKWD